jgi:phospho-N-acetylmuramoyl-pentapeptide-transferase
MLQILPGFLISLAIALLIGPSWIKFMARVKAGQTIRSEGPESHLKKMGTPMMGGFIFLIPTTIVSLFYVRSFPKVIPVLILMWGFAAVGFIDDYIKVVLKRSMGLKAWQKMGLQIIVCAAFYFVASSFTELDLTLKVPFANGMRLELGAFAIPAMFFIAIATVNGTNFTDGVDGLSSSVTSVVAGFFAIASLMLKGGVEPMAAAFLGGLLGYLVYNLYPAKIFMGDTGSLALGGFVAGCAYMMELPLFIPIVGIIYFVEVLSVIIQVSYFKITKGKRIFRMAPIHHHFEKGGWSETRVVGVFTIVTVVACVIGFAGLW